MPTIQKPRRAQVIVEYIEYILERETNIHT